VADETIFREVDEAVRRDQLLGLWKRYGAILIGAILVVILTVAGFQLYQLRREAQLAQAGERYQALVEAAEDATGARRADLLADGAELPAGYDDLVRLQQAAAFVEDGDIEQAIGLYAAVADAAPQALVRDYAAIAAARLMLDQGNPDALIARLQPMSGEGAPFQAAALELLALAHLQLEDAPTAQSYLSQILALQTAPATLRARAEDLLALLRMAPAAGAQAAEPAPATPTPATPATAAPATEVAAEPDAGDS